MDETTTREVTDERRALEDTIQRLKDDQDRIFRNVAGVFDDAVDAGDMEADLALEMLSNAGIPERYWDHIGMVDVDVEVTVRATVVYTTTVQTKVRRDQIDDHDVAYDTSWTTASSRPRFSKRTSTIWSSRTRTGRSIRSARSDPLGGVAAMSHPPPTLSTSTSER